MAEIRVELEGADSTETVRFSSDQVLAHHGLTDVWEDLLEVDQMSLAEDYALWAEKRRFGDFADYHVTVL